MAALGPHEERVAFGCFSPFCAFPSGTVSENSLLALPLELSEGSSRTAAIVVGSFVDHSTRLAG